MEEDKLDWLEEYMRSRLDIARNNNEYMEAITVCGVLVEVEKARQLRTIDATLTSILDVLGNK